MNYIFHNTRRIDTYDGRSGGELTEKIRATVEEASKLEPTQVTDTEKAQDAPTCEIGTPCGETSRDRT